MKNEKQNLDLPFLIFIAVIVVALVVTSVVTYFSASKEPTDNIPTASPSPTSYETPQTSTPPTTSPSDVTASFEYNLPRNPNLSLSSNIKWEITVGGKGTDTITEVITLDKFYVFGTLTQPTLTFPLTAAATYSTLYYRLTESSKILSPLEVPIPT